MILKVLLVAVAVVAVILILAALKPSSFVLERAITINAAPDKIFPLIDNLQNWPRWAPQDREDPAMKRTFSGPDSGVGAISQWSGAGKTGAGVITITESDSPGLVILAADWQRPFAVRNINKFQLEPSGSGTRVTWSVTGPSLFMMKLMSVFTNMDRMMGSHFESGLQNLKTIAEQ